MTTAAITGPSRRGWDGLRREGKKFLAFARQHTRPLTDHITEYGYTLLMVACFDAAGFVHSVFTGLIVSAAGFAVMEFRTKEYDNRNQ